MKPLAMIALVCLSILTKAQPFITNNGIQITNTAQVTTTGSWMNDPGTVIINDGTITTVEAWENMGTYSGNGTIVLDYGKNKNFAPGTGLIYALMKTGVGNAMVSTPIQVKNQLSLLGGAIVTTSDWQNLGASTGNGKLILDYSADHNLSSVGAISSLQKIGPANALVTGRITVLNELLLDAGLLQLANTADTLIIKNGATVTALPISYVEGVVAHEGNGTKLFPLGKDGNYLPISLHKFNASKATAVVEGSPTPGTYSEGPGVDALIDFPYVWKIAEKAPSDTSAYVEVSYPDSFSAVVDPIVAREIPGLKYASMGARLIDQSGGRVTVKSYSRRLKGTFTIAQGFGGDFVTDSLALVSLYNNTNGPGWTNKANWLTGDVETWFGITVTGQSITAVNLSGNGLAGSVPDPLVDILALQDVNLSSNSITSIPDFTDNEEISTLNVSGNKLEFGALEANSALLDPEIVFNYTNQADLGTATDELIDVGTAKSVTAATEGVNNTYQWKRNGVAVGGATTKTFTINSVARETMGEYICEVNNNLFPGLTLRTAPQKLTAIAKLSGKLFASEGNAASKGTMTLFKINETGKYDTTAVKSVNPDGTYLFEKVIVDDYQLLGFVDTLTYAKALPTYYSTNTVYWEEAQTIAVNSNLNTLNIVSAYVPTEVPKGVGIISGYFEEPENPGGRGEAAKRVSGAGASVRSVQNVARPLGEKLTLVAYVFTNDQGEFELQELPKGDYRLNIQYPGYPMDKTSFIDMTIGDGLESQVRVAAAVQDNKIKVTKLVITGVWEKDGINVQVYPNPSADHVMVRFTDASPTRSMELVNMLSEKLSSHGASQKENKLSVDQFPAGIYLLHVKEKGEIVKTVRIAVK